VVLVQRGRHAEAEPLLREALVIRERAIPDHWFTAETRSVLGEVLLAQGRIDAAGLLLEDSARRIASLRGAEDEFAARARDRVARLRIARQGEPAARRGTP
jgi:hypothetical protein